MTIQFLNSLLFPFLMLASVPLVLHLLARSKPPVYFFSSNEFLLKIIRNTMRIKKPQDLLLLILRTLLFLAIICIFLQPLLFSNKLFSGLLKKKNVVVIVDASASMGYVEGGQSRFNLACAEASEVLSALKSSSKANIVWLKYKPEAVFPNLGENFNYLQNELRKATVSNEAGNVADALKLAVKMLENQDGQKEICIISDFQKTQWQDVTLSLPETIHAINIKVGKNKAENIAVANIITSPSVPLINDKTAVTCEIRNFSAAPRKCNIYFKAPGVRQTRNELIPAWGSCFSTYLFQCAEAGRVPFEITIDDESFTADNKRWKVVPFNRYINVELCNSDSPTMFYWRKALRSLPWINSHESRLDQLSDQLVTDILMIADWDGQKANEIAQLMKKGVIVILQPSAGLNLNGFDPILGKEQLQGIVETPVLKQPVSLVVKNAKDPILDIFAKGEYGDPAGGRFTKINSFKLPSNDFAEVIMNYSDQAKTPALVRFKKNQNDFYLWNINLDSKDSNWASKVQFLPFLAELLFNSRNSSSALKSYIDHMPGQVLSYKIADRSVNGIVLKDPKNELIKTDKQIQKDGIVLVSNELDQCGPYTWQHNNKVLGWDVINFSGNESDLRTITTDQLQKMGELAKSGGEVKNMHEGVKLWPYLLFAAIVLVVLENIVTYWTEKT